MTAKEILEEHLNTMGATIDDSLKTFVLFAMEEYAQEQVKNCSIPDVGRTLVCECLMPSIVGTPTNKNCMGCGKPFKAT